MAVSNTGKLAGRTIFISGASRGIGKAIALKCARDGANVVIAAKTAEAHPKLPGTIYTAAKEVEEAGGKCLPCLVDIRDEQQVEKAVGEAVSKFGGIDILVNNASAIHLTGTEATPMKRFDLMMGINTRGTFLCSKYCAPHLKKGNNPHILNLSPPLNLNPVWFKNHVAYTMAKYGMSMCVLGMAEEFRSDGIAVNALWPRTAIYTAAMDMLGGSGIKAQCRKDTIMSDAAYVILSRDSKSATGNFYIDDEVLTAEGVTDLDQYAAVPGGKLLPDFFLDGDPEKLTEQMEAEGASPKFAVSGSSGSEPDATFKTMKSILNEDLVKSINAVFQFDFKEGDAWYLDLKNGAGETGQGTPPSGKPDCNMAMDTEAFTKMFAGQLDPTTAFMTGKLKIKGDMTAALKLEKVMKQMKSKL